MISDYTPTESKVIRAIYSLKLRPESMVVSWLSSGSIAYVIYPGSIKSIYCRLKEHIIFAIISENVYCSDVARFMETKLGVG